ncbi:MAG: tetratricopeptide repeat-containing protein kinase family protein, partial [Acidobacteriota bacterium]
VALFRALYGEPPFAPGPGGQGPPDWSEVTSPEGRGIPAPLRRILLRGLSLRPEDRYPSMEDLLARLEGVPRRRRRLALAAAAVPIALVSALVLRGPGDEPPCRSAPGQLAEVWNEERRAAVVAGFSAIPRPYAPLVAVAVGEALDAYGRGWVSQHVDACEATHVRGEQSAALLDLRMACLDQRQRELDALVGLFQEDPAATVETAFQAVGELANPDACADTRALLAPMSEPVDAESRRRVAEVRDELASVAALQATGRYSEGAELAADLVERTKTIRYLPLAAEALLRLGRLQEGAGEPAQATDSLQHALWTAQAGGHERVAAEAFIRLVRVVGFQQADFERGRFYAEMADALVERLGETGRLRSTLADHLGLLAFQEGQYAAAAEHHRQAVEERQRLGAGADAVTETGVAQSLVRLGTALLEQGALEEAEAELQKALEIYLPRLGSEHPDVAATFDRLGTVAYRGGDLETAEGLYRRSLEAFSQGLGAGHPKVAAGCMHLGNVLTARGDAASALELYDRALQIYSSSLGENHPHVAIAWTNVGATRVELGEHQSAVEAFGRALEIQRGVYGDDHPWVATTVFNLGETLNELGNFGAAERQHRSALEVFRRSYGDTHPMVAHGLHGLGRALHGQGRNDPALPLLEEALEVWNGAGQDPRHAAETRWLMAQLLVAEDRPRAIELAREAVAGFRASEGDHRAQQEAALGWLSDQGAEGRS